MRTLEDADLPAVAAVHIASFPGSLLTNLGPTVVARYYQWQLSPHNDAHSTALFEGGELVGFAIGGRFHDSVNGFYLANRRLIAAAVMRHPRILLSGLFWDRWSMLSNSFKRARRRRRRAGQPPRPKDVERELMKRTEYTVLSVATHPDHRRKGVGRRLLAEQEAIARQLGFKAMRLSVHADNRDAVAFYLADGWTTSADDASPDLKMRKQL